MTMRRNTSYGNLPDNESEAKVLVIYTGGTIGMMRNEHNGKLINNNYIIMDNML